MNSENLGRGHKDVKRIYRKHSFGSEISKKIRNLCKQVDNFHGPFALVTDVFVICLAIGICLVYPLFYPISLILIGSRQRALDTLLHEACHSTLTRNRILNNALGMLAGWSVYHTFYEYQQSHVKEHHVFLGDDIKDPDMKNYISQQLFETNPDTILMSHFVPRLLGFKSISIIKNIAFGLFLKFDWKKASYNGKKEQILFLGFWILVLSIILYNGLLYYFLVFWIIPYFTIFQAIEWITEVAEHFPLTKLFDSELYITRNRTGNLIERFFTGIHGEDWHLVHHLHPGIPFWKLTTAHKIMMSDEVYENANSNSGGLFSKGPTGKPSIVSLLNEQLAGAQHLVR